MNTTNDDGDDEKPRPGPLAFNPNPASDEPAGEDMPRAGFPAFGSDPAPAEPSAALTETDAGEDEADRDEDESGDEGDQEGEGGQGEADGGGGGVTFEETEHDFDDAELQGLSLPIFRRALKKGLQLASRVTKTVERDLRNFLPHGLHTRVVELAFSKKGHPTLLLDKGEIVQYQMSAKGKLERVRVSPDLEAERAVKYAMAGFIAAGESIDPAHVKFGRSPQFESRMKPIWTREYHRIQQQEQDMRMDMRLKDVRFAVGREPRAKPAAKVPAWMAARQPPAPRRTPAIDLPRGGTQGQAHRPGL